MDNAFEPAPIADESQDVTVESAKNDLYHNPDKLIRMALGLKTFAWIILAISGLYSIVNLVALFMQNSNSSVLILLANIPGSLWVLAIGLFYFAMLRIVSELILLFMDVEDNGRRAAALLEKLLRK